MVPEGWYVEPLGELTSKGISYGIVQTGESGIGDIPCVRVVDLAKKHMSPIEMITTTAEISLSYKKTVLEPDEIMLALRGEIGLVRMVPDNLVGCNLTRGIARIAADQTQIHPQYLLWGLRSSSFRRDLMRRVNGSALQEIPLGELKKVLLLVPPMVEQKRIAEILSTWDRSIETVEKLIENSERQKKALARRLLLGRDRFTKYQGNHTSFVKLKTLCTVRRGASPRPISDPKWFADEGRGWVRIADVTASQTEYLEGTEQYLSELGVERTVSVNPGELIMSICATIGVPKIVGVPVCIHDGFVVFRDLNAQLNTSFLYHYLELYSARLVNSGQPGTQKNLNTSIVGNIDFPVISHGEQVDIASVLDAQDRETRVLVARRLGLVQEKTALMQQLLTGKRRVKVDRDVDRIVGEVSAHG